MIEFLSAHPRDRLALVDSAAGTRLTYGELADRVAVAADKLNAAAGRSLAFLAMGPDAGAVVLYLACLEARLPLVLTDTEPKALAQLVAAYRPTMVLQPSTSEPLASYREQPLDLVGYRMGLGGSPVETHADLALLLTTSGSTGNPKLVRLTRRNLVSNARSIVEYLSLDSSQRAIMSLPMHYSYGLSVLDSHLLSGGSVVLTPHSFIRPEFWSAVDGERCTSFAGVPYMYETLHRLRFDPAKYAALRTLTQAGGPLRRDLQTHYQQLTSRGGSRLFVMYGQTEATARISYVPPDWLASKIGSIGIAIPGGALTLAPVDDDPDLTELVYEGPNVMMGYAESTADLALGDVQHGVLKTGDLATCDEDGYYSIVGRLKRFAKLFGRRVSLEDIERSLESELPVRVAATDGGDRILVHAESDAGVTEAAIVAHTSRFLAVPPSAVAVRLVAALPRTSSGKKDYRALEVAT